MRIIISIVALLFTSFSLTFAGGGHDHNVEMDNEFKLTEDVVKKLGIKWEPVKKRTIQVSKKYPAVVKDDLTLSEAVYSPVEGLIKMLLVKEGDPVVKGQKLALIYSPEIRKLTADIKLAKVRLKNLKAVYEREKQLYEKKVIPYSRYFQAKINYENALGELQALEESLKAYGEIENGLLVLKAHIDGYVAQQNVVLGDSVDLGKQIFKIHSHDVLWVVALVPVVDTVLFKKNLEVTIISPLGKTTGIVDFISHKVDPETKLNQVRIIADNKKETLKPNMFVDVYIRTGKITDLFIPEKAVVIKDGKFFVFLKKGEHVHPVEVHLKEKINGYYRLVDGIKEGELLITEGVSFLKSRFLAEVEGH
ncbi:efflux RND transporter periplasmic adaptor subunit [Persephonella sp.]